MNRIENQTIFGRYEQEENRVTAALLQVLKNGGTNFIAEVISQIDDVEFPSSEIEIRTQKGEENNIYDGLLECSFSFRILVESKIKVEAINTKQLEGLISNVKYPSSEYILYITPDAERPKALKRVDTKIYWTNWKGINKILEESNPHTEPTSYLIEEFSKYLNHLGLLDVVEAKNQVQIAAGSYGEPVALKYGFYACQNNRTRRDCKYLAFYNNKGIHSLFEIIGEPSNDTDLSAINDSNVIEYLKVQEHGYNSHDKRQFYKLKHIKTLSIKHQKKNKNGKASAYTMGVFRYTTIDKIEKAKTTDDL